MTGIIIDRWWASYIASNQRIQHRWMLKGTNSKYSLLLLNVSVLSINKLPKIYYRISVSACTIVWVSVFKVQHSLCFFSRYKLLLSVPISYLRIITGMQALAMKPEFATPLLKEQIQRGFSILSVLETIPCNAPVLKLLMPASELAWNIPCVSTIVH